MSQLSRFDGYSFVELRSQLSYANVVATVALFASLGGGAYAALTLPVDSVGRAQLKDGAVGVRELGVALGASSRVDESSHEIQRARCGTEGGPPVPCPAPPPVTLATDSVKSERRGVLLVSALAGMYGRSGTTGDANVSLTVLVDGRELPGRSHARIPPDTPNPVEVPYQSSVRVPAGRHKVTLLINASDYEGTLAVSPIALNSVVLPAAK